MWRKRHGAGLPYLVGIPGEILNAIYSGNEFLTRTNLMRAWNFQTEISPFISMIGCSYEPSRALCSGRPKVGEATIEPYG